MSYEVPPRKEDKPGKLFVNGLDPDLDEEKVEKAFAKYGPIAEVRIIRDRNSQVSKGFGYVSYEYPEDAEDAIKGLDKSKLGSGEISVEVARVSAKMSSDRGSRGRGGYSRYEDRGSMRGGRDSYRGRDSGDRGGYRGRSSYRGSDRGGRGSFRGDRGGFRSDRGGGFRSERGGGFRDRGGFSDRGGSRGRGGFRSENGVESRKRTSSGMDRPSYSSRFEGGSSYRDGPRDSFRDPPPRDSYRDREPRDSYRPPARDSRDSYPPRDEYSSPSSRSYSGGGDFGRSPPPRGPPSRYESDRSRDYDMNGRGFDSDRDPYPSRDRDTYVSRDYGRDSYPSSRDYDMAPPRSRDYDSGPPPRSRDYDDRPPRYVDDGPPSRYDSYSTSRDYDGGDAVGG